MGDVVVITAPSGKQCSHLIPLLREVHHYTLRLAAHSSQSVEQLASRYPETEILQSDLSNIADCRRLLEGATSVYHVGPSFHSREMEMGFNMVDAAVAESEKPGSKFRHFIFSSVLCTQHRNLIQHDVKSRVEERLALSQLNYTILQPTNFMDTYPIQELKDQEFPVFERIWSPEIPNSVLALKDLAEAAARVLKEGEPHYWAQYPLCSTLPISDAEIIQIIAKAIGKDIMIRKPSFEQGVENVLHFLFDTRGPMLGKQRVASAQDDMRSDLTRDQAERLVLFYNRRGLRGSPSILRWLLSREPTSVKEWVEQQLG